MKPAHTLTIIPRLPPSLERLRELAYNLRWSWNHDAIALFRRLDSDLWEKSGHNPVRMLGIIDQKRLEDAAANESFVAHLDRVYSDFENYMKSTSSWFSKTHGDVQDPLVAYFSAEFGLTECMSIFAGGLGILSGDHLKSSSDLGVPLVGIGLLYQQGYFRQYLNAAGWQQEDNEDNDFHAMPAALVRGHDGKKVVIEINYPNNKVFAQVWRVAAGRVSLYLLDTNIPENERSEDRDITDQLYGGDIRNRIRQEILLGIGGCRTLEALDLHPTVYHMNEGHSAFGTLELVRSLMEKHSLSFAEARELASTALVFTTHTPVTAGHDYFPPELMDQYFSEFIPKLGIDRKRFLALGRRNPEDDRESFCMTILALRMANFSNGVSRLHGQISRRLWRDLWPDVPEEEIPITHITNGVHFLSWISQEMEQLYERYLGPSWREQPAEKSVWRRVESIAAEELWHTHERRRERLVAFARRRLHEQMKRRNASQAEIQSIEDALDPDALTIGFARRFATYKRGTLILRNKERLARILNDPKRPVQIIFAGKAHPQDDAGKDLIRQIILLAREPQFRHRMVFLEDYDVSVARYLVQGVDIWLNTPLRPNEASGTSGMKALANGALNVSTLDGWWDEAYLSTDSDHRPVGWAIGRGESYSDRDYQDQVEADALYDILERDIIPTFYDRRADSLPRRWVALMMSSIHSLCPQFNTNRMIREYTEKFYLPAHLDHQSLIANGAALAKEHAATKRRIRTAWPSIQVEMLESKFAAEIPAEESVSFSARVRTGALTPEDIRVELYTGPLNSDGEITRPTIAEMQPVRRENDAYIYEVTTVPCCGSGLHGYTARVLPRHPDLKHPFAFGVITWAI
ncbi:MAG: alpha-glucan family phosphorylase [Acidobacteria bacterium]|nr:alpha-glucan family phosphorylase [Acidobacteriota bacterium]